MGMKTGVCVCVFKTCKVWGLMIGMGKKRMNED